MPRPFAAARCLPGGFVLALLSAMGGQPSASPQQSPQNPPVFRAGTNVVPVDVTVVDRNGQPVTGLGAADFTVRENGQVRPVVAFSAVSVPLPAPPEAAWMDETTPDVATNQVAARRIVVLAFCDLLGPIDVQDYETMLGLGHALLRELGPTDLTSVVYLFHPELGQPFTVAKAPLVQAVDRLNTTVFDTGPMLVRLRENAGDILTDLVASLANVPDRHKVIFLIGDGHEVIPARARADLYRVAGQSNVTIHCLSLALMLAGSDNFCKEVAANTGGEAIVDTNEPAREVPALVRASQTYYVLGFEPVPGGHEALTRRIDVTVDRPGVTVRSRRTYETASAVPPTALAATDAAYASPLPADDLGLRLTAIPVASAVTGLTPVVVALTVAEPNVRSDVLQVEVGTETDRGREDHGGRETVRWTPQATPTGEREGTLFARVNLPPGYHELRAAVDSAALKRAGSVLADVYVPDFAKAPVAISGLVLHTPAPTVTVGSESLRGLLPVVPTTRRLFTAAEAVTASFVVTEGGSDPPRPVTVTMTVTDAHDQAVSGSTQTLEVTQIAAAVRWVATSFPVPLSHLSSGRYLLTLEAKAGEHQTDADVQFSVR